MFKDIKTCQSKGKKILLSLGKLRNDFCNSLIAVISVVLIAGMTGGAVGTYGFSNDAAAQSYADQLWGLFGNGGGSTRPFDNAVIDGFDLDIEGGTNTGYAAFITQMRTHYGMLPIYDLFKRCE